MARRKILFVHGMFMTSRCWDGWVARYRARGLDVEAIAWPGRDGPLEQLRQRANEGALARLGFEDVVAHHVRAIESMSEPPILIGHSMGGLVVQVLLHRGLGAAGVAIDSAPPRGVFVPKFSLLRANWPVLNPFLSAARPFTMSFPRFQYAFVNGMPLEEQRQAYDTQVVPESLRVPRESRSHGAAIDFSRSHPPLLLVAGSTDHIIPAALNQRNFQRYRRGSDSRVELKLFPGRNHYGVLAGPNWEEVADMVLTWTDGAVPTG